MHDRDLPGNVGAMALRCVIVDDSPAFVAAARSLLERQGVAVLADAATTAEAVRLAAELHPDVLLVDIDLGPESGLELARRLARSTPAAPPVILISTYAEEDYADLIGDSPALGFIPKSGLSAAAIRALLDTGRPPGPVSEPPGT
jgi:two-component system, NarL family, nitrate/nitrite response regulator NarL